MNTSFELIEESRLSSAVWRKGIPFFSQNDNYVQSFGDQWNRYRTLQLDSVSGVDLSRLRLERCLGFSLESIAGLTVLEAGSGAGRFTEHLSKYCKELYSFDLSSAVFANALNSVRFDNLTLVQADILAMPFRKESFDIVICLGVLQHTPSTVDSIEALWEMVSPGGRLVFDHYIYTLGNVLPPPIGRASYVYRRLFLLLPRYWRNPLVKAIVDFWFPIHWMLREFHFLDRFLSRLSPVFFYYNNKDVGLPSKKAYYEWELLDTHDALTDEYKRFVKPKFLYDIVVGLGASEISLSKSGNGIEVSCKKPVLSF